MLHEATINTAMVRHLLRSPYPQLLNARALAFAIYKRIPSSVEDNLGVRATGAWAIWPLLVPSMTGMGKIKLGYVEYRVQADKTILGVLPVVDKVDQDSLAYFCRDRWCRVAIWAL